MKNISLLTIMLLIISSCTTQNEIIPDLTKTNDSETWVLHNRNLTPGEEIYLDDTIHDGLLWMKDIVFSNGTIEVDLKGKDVRGRSFLGIAFHGLNDSTFDVVYFRPFNFKSPERSNHAVQYVSHPTYPWYILRENFPEQYENPVAPIPDPADWFHAKIVVQHPSVKVYVNNSEEPSLEIDQLTDRIDGWLGFWVGYGSDGAFRNLKIVPDHGDQ
jgi:hypothetical protein